MKGSETEQVAEGVEVQSATSQPVQNKSDRAMLQNFMEYPTAYLSAFTILAICFALLFNIGYFYPLGIEFLTFLTLKDVFETTLPFMVLGLVSILLIMFVDIFAGGEESVKAKFQRYYIDEFKGLHVVARVVAWVFATPFFILNLIGSYILYYWLYIRLQSFSSAIEQGDNQIIFSNGIVPWIIVAVLVVLFDLLIRSRPKRYKSRKLVMRLIVLSSFICFSEGSAFLAKQLRGDTKWTIELNNDRILVGHVVLRSTERGILVFDRNNKSAELVLFGELKSISKSLNADK